MHKIIPSPRPTPMIHVSKHPLVKHKVARLRDVETGPKEFRELVGELAQLLIYEATSDLPTHAVNVRTPLADCRGDAIRARIGIIPILRAGLGMAEAMLRVLPNAIVWHLGLFRDHVTHQPITYYNKLPATAEHRRRAHCRPDARDRRIGVRGRVASSRTGDSSTSASSD